jgi:hypothetical protein
LEVGQHAGCHVPREVPNLIAETRSRMADWKAPIIDDSTQFLGQDAFAMTSRDNFWPQQADFAKLRNGS